MNKQELREQYLLLLKSLDNDTKRIMLTFIDKMEKQLLEDKDNIGTAIKELRMAYTQLIKDSSSKAVSQAKKLKQAEFGDYHSKVEKMLSTKNISNIEGKAITDQIKISFGDGIEKQIVNSVWNRIWPDALNVDDRIKLLSAKVKTNAEQIIKQGIINGDSARNIANQLKSHFIDGGLETRSALRLAAHTTSMVYESTNAEISMGANFIMGVRIIRGMYGSISPKCPVCLEHGGTDYKEYFKSDFGGRDLDLWIMTNSPSYHSHCNCGLELIEEDAETFIKRAREQYKSTE